MTAERTLWFGNRSSSYRQGAGNRRRIDRQSHGPACLGSWGQIPMRLDSSLDEAQIVGPF